MALVVELVSRLVEVGSRLVWLNNLSVEAASRLV
jgi:hypothetical protein